MASLPLPRSLHFCGRVAGIFLSGVVLLATSALVADETTRTWTSSDGSRTFEGKFRSFNPERKEAEVIVNGQAVKFPIDLLSAADIAYIEELAQNDEPVDPSHIKEIVEQTSLGAQILKAKPHRFDGRRYRRADLVKSPEFYVLYYAASW